MDPATNIRFSKALRNRKNCSSFEKFIGMMAKTIKSYSFNLAYYIYKPAFKLAKIVPLPQNNSAL